LRSFLTASSKHLLAIRGHGFFLIFGFIENHDFFKYFRSDSENSLSSEPSSQFLAMSKLPALAPPFNNGAGKAFKIFP
jgi:hypothetical protein